MDKRFFVAASRQTRARTEPVWDQVEKLVPQEDCELLREGLHSLRFTARRDLTVTVAEEEGFFPLLVVERDAREVGKTSCKVEVEFSRDDSGQLILTDDVASVDVLAADGRGVAADLPVEVVMHAVYGVLTNAGVEVAMQMGIIPVWWTGRRPQYETRIDSAPTGMESSLFFALGARMLAHDLREGDGVVPSGKLEFIPEDDAMFIPMVDQRRRVGDDSPVEKINWPPVRR